MGGFCPDDRRLYGFYRGEVLRHLDNGMCKIFVYGAYPDEFKGMPDMLPDAE